MLGLWLLIAAVIVCIAIAMNPASEKATDSSVPPIAAPTSSTKDTDSSKKDTATSKTERFHYIREIDKTMEGQTITTTGTVTKISEGKGNTYFTLTDLKTKKSIHCVIFSKTHDKNPNYKNLVQESKNNTSAIEIQGKVNIHEGELQIIIWTVSVK